MARIVDEMSIRRFTEEMKERDYSDAQIISMICDAFELGKLTHTEPRMILHDFVNYYDKCAANPETDPMEIEHDFSFLGGKLG